jgi:signal peptidase I
MSVLSSIGGVLNSRKAGNVLLLVLLLFGGYYFAVRGMRFFAVPSQSMEPTLLPGDQLVTLKESSYQRGDIVVFRAGGEYLVKRIAGVGGDRLLIAEGALFINDSYASEPYILEPMRYSVSPPVEVPEGNVFVLGDNRNNSEDSSYDRMTYPVSSIIGKVVFRYFPYDRWGRVSPYPLQTANELAPAEIRAGRGAAATP